jgi:hypothetical protein
MALRFAVMRDVFVFLKTSLVSKFSNFGRARYATIASMLMIFFPYIDLAVNQMSFASSDVTNAALEVPPLGAGAFLASVSTIAWIINLYIIVAEQKCLADGMLTKSYLWVLPSWWVAAFLIAAFTLQTVSKVMSS